MQPLLSLFKDFAKDKVINTNFEKSVEELLLLDNKTKHLCHIQALLEWDQEVFMPKSGIDNRCNQMSLVEGFIHEEEVNPRVAELLSELGVTEEQQRGSELLPDEIGFWLRAKYKQWKTAASLPPALLQEIIRLRVKSHHVWIEAKKNNDFLMFAPYLEKTVALQREKADCLGYEKSRYDALLNEYEHNITSKKIADLFSDLEKKLVPIYHEAIERSKKFTITPVSASKEEQMNFGQELMKFVGFSKDDLRLDCSAHPFSVAIGKNDARITTKCIEDNPLVSIFSTLHEMGHSFYDLGISDMYKGTVCGDGASYGMHESQSRFLENIMGRSPEFWETLYPVLQDTMSGFKGESFENFMKRILYVTPNPIRMESDEIGYGLHIALRFEIEKDLIDNNLSVYDVPKIWNEKMKKNFGLEIKNDSEGVLQDVHWSEGYFGYFPSYGLGNLYSAKLYDELKVDMPKHKDILRSGNYGLIREWLGNRIHIYGASKLPSELLELLVDPEIEYLKERYLI